MECEGSVCFYKRINQSILKEISPEYSLEEFTEAEAPILWPPDVKSCLNGEHLDAGKDGEQEEKGQWRMRWWDGITDPMDMSVKTQGDSEGQGRLGCCSLWGCKGSDAT